MSKTYFNQLEPKGMKKRLTLTHIVAYPFVVAFSMVLVALYGMVFSPAEAASYTGFTGWFVHYMAPVMFVTMIFLLLLGYPTAFTLAANGMIFGAIGISLGLFPSNFFQAMPNRVFDVMASDTLLAIPFFTLMGLILERSGMAEDLLDTIGQLFGTIRGGIAYAVIFVGTLLAATTGVVAASVIAMGFISLPIMLRYNYDRRLAAGVITAAGTLAQIIPPSLVLIVMADQLGVDVGNMYTAAFVPGFMLTIFYAIWVFIQTRLSAAAAPGLPLEAIGYHDDKGGRGLGLLAVFTGSIFFISYFLASTFGISTLSWLRADGIPIDALKTDEFVVILLFFMMSLMFIAAALNFLLRKTSSIWLLNPITERVAFVLVPPLFLIFLVLGTIIIGAATPTEGGAYGAVGAMLLAAINRLISGDKSRFNIEMLTEAVRRTAKLSAFVLFILIGARLFSLTFYGVDGHIWVEEILTGLPGGVFGFLIIVNLVIFILGCFLDFFEIAFIAVPLIAPAAAVLGIDIVWLGIIISLNLQTSFLTPPFGFALIYMRSVSPKKPYKDSVTGKTIDKITTEQIYMGGLPYIAIQTIMVILVVAFPPLVMHYQGGGVQLDEAQQQEALDNLGSGFEIELDLPSF